MALVHMVIVSLLSVTRVKIQYWPSFMNYKRRQLTSHSLQLASNKQIDILQKGRPVSCIYSVQFSYAYYFQLIPCRFKYLFQHLLEKISWGPMALA